MNPHGTEVGSEARLERSAERSIQRPADTDLIQNRGAGGDTWERLIPEPAIGGCGDATTNGVHGDAVGLLLEIVRRIATLLSEPMQVPIR
jgi:hypothetical protein